MNHFTAEIERLLCLPAENGRDMVRLSREIMHAYSAAGLSIDDVEVESILAIESETDDIELESSLSSEELDRVYLMYKDAFEEGRQEIRTRLERLRRAT